MSEVSFAKPQGEDGPVWDRFADDCLDWLWSKCGKDSRQYTAAIEFATDRTAAYNEIERLRSENEELKETLELYEDEYNSVPLDETLIKKNVYEFEMSYPCDPDSPLSGMVLHIEEPTK